MLVLMDYDKSRDGVGKRNHFPHISLKSILESELEYIRTKFEHGSLQCILVLY